MTLDDLIAAVKTAHAEATPLRLRGAGSKDFYGTLLAGEVLDVSAYRGIIAYEPTELYITVKGGTPLSEIEAALAEKGQMLAFEPPGFGTSTAGGCVAAGLSGPRRQQAGAVRDFVLGVKLIDGTGQVLDFGGQVMKNVAGYDVSRLLAGSMGTLGLLAEVSLKVLPRPVAEATIVFEMNESEAIVRLNRWGGQPLPVSASFWSDGRLFLRLSGARAAVDAARRKLGGELAVAGKNLWKSVREQTPAAFVGPLLWRLAVPSFPTPGCLAWRLAQEKYSAPYCLLHWRISCRPVPPLFPNPGRRRPGCRAVCSCWPVACNHRSPRISMRRVPVCWPGSGSSCLKKPRPDAVVQCVFT